MDIYETHILPPQLPFIFHRGIHLTPTNSAEKGMSNWHENIEILYVREGSGRVMNDGESYPALAGDLAVIGANGVHDVSPDALGIRYDCLIIDRAFCLSNYVDTSALRFVPLFQDGEIAALFDVLDREYGGGEEESYRVQTVRAAVLSVLARLCRRYSSPSSGERDTRGIASIKRAISYIRAHPEAALTLKEVSARVGLSKYHFAREFRRIAGYTFVTYVNIVRCERAKRLLTEGTMTIGEIAAASGFSSPSYFTRIFREHVGMLPGAYRARMGTGDRAEE